MALAALAALAAATPRPPLLGADNAQDLLAVMAVDAPKHKASLELDDATLQALLQVGMRVRICMAMHLAQTAHAAAYGGHSREARLDTQQSAVITYT